MPVSRHDSPADRPSSVFARRHACGRCRPDEHRAGQQCHGVFGCDGDGEYVQRHARHANGGKHAVLPRRPARQAGLRQELPAGPGLHDVDLRA